MSDCWLACHTPALAFAPVSEAFTHQATTRQHVLTSPLEQVLEAVVTVLLGLLSAGWSSAGGQWQCEGG